ncbi:MAG TPA: transglycosylase domain-containing protein [Candidatus Limnocylindria bacterium]|jgi:penicillin-binding protein 1C
MTRIRRSTGLALALGILALAAYARFAPLAPLAARGALPGLVILDAQGTVLATDRSDGLRLPVSLERIAPVLLQATISAEDRRFQQHIGIDPIAVGRALLQPGSRPSGASTITQQLARRLYLADDTGPVLVRKAREALIALQLEARSSKREILEGYLNAVYYGRGAYGIEAAARAYFGIGASDLDLAHATYLAGLPQRPSTFGSGADDAAARARQAYVLDRMVADGWVDRASADAAAAVPIAPTQGIRPPAAPAFVRAAIVELARVRPDLAGRPGLIIETTLDGGLQAEVVRLARARVAALADRNVTDAALVAIEPPSGRVVALVGDATDGDPAHGGDLDLATTPRQPGSALKPFLYAAAFERGFTPATPLLDVATTFSTNEGPYAPLNFDRSFHGVVPLRTALASSLNVPAVRTLDAIGIDAMLEISQRFGLATLSQAERYGLSLSLGGGEVRLLDLTAAYAALATGGERHAPYVVERVRDGSGAVLYAHASGPAAHVVTVAQAYLIADILSDPDARIPGFGGVTPFDLPFRAAAKSGTSTGFRDNWAFGFTPEIAIGVWAGNADGSPMIDVSGVEGAGPIWHDAMQAAALGRRMTWYDRPPGVVEAMVCAPTGLLPGPACPSVVRELFVAGTEPTAHERYYAYDAAGALTIDPPTEARAWASDAGLTLATTERSTVADPLRVVAPASGTVFWLAPELGRQELLLRAAAAPGIDRVTFELDGRTIGSVAANDPTLAASLDPGRHVLRLLGRLPDGTVALATASYEVRR